MIEKTENWQEITEEEKQKQLYIKQKNLLDTFLEHGAITQEQYNKSLETLTDKMGMQEILHSIASNNRKD